MNQPFSRTQFPNGGWEFFQPQTGWHAPTPKSSTFDQTVRQIIEMRKKNPASILKHSLSVDPVTVGNELEAYTRRRLGIVSPMPTPPSALMPGVTTTIVSSTDDIKKLALGTGVLLAWERTQEGPVTKDIAEYRAGICAQCVLNDIGKYEEWKKSPVGATAIMKTPRTSSLIVSTKQDANLGLCKGCYCPTARLVSMPLGIAVKRIGSAVTALDEKCWLRV